MVIRTVVTLTTVTFIRRLFITPVQERASVVTVFGHAWAWRTNGSPFIWMTVLLWWRGGARALVARSAGGYGGQGNVGSTRIGWTACRILARRFTDIRMPVIRRSSVRSGETPSVFKIRGRVSASEFPQFFAQRRRIEFLFVFSVQVVEMIGYTSVV